MTLEDLRQRALERLNENHATPVFYTAADALASLNLAQRFYAFLTLCLESTRPFQLTPGNQWYQLQRTFADAILLLRCSWQNIASTGADSIFNVPAFGGAGFNDQAVTVATAATPKLQPASFEQMSARNNNWLGTAGMPTSYNASGFGLLVFDKNPDQQYTAMITYARMPIPLVNDTDVPEIPEPDHQSLIDFAVGFLRVREGGQELQNDAPGLQSFLAVVKRRAAQVRARSLAQRYDHAPAELELPDLSRMLKMRPALTPNRKGAEWTSPQ